MTVVMCLMLLGGVLVGWGIGQYAAHHDCRTAQAQREQVTRDAQERQQRLFRDWSEGDKGL
jgi:hypothetical protein